MQTVVTTEPAVEGASGGGRSYAFWLLVAVVLLVAVFNLLITLTLISVLRVSVGMESIQFVSGGMVLPGTVSLDRLYKPDGQFLGFRDDPVTITGDVGQVDLLVSDAAEAGFEPTESQRVRLSPSTAAADGVRVEGVARAAVSASPGAPFFSTDYPNFGLPAGVRSLRVQEARTRRLVSPVDQSLRLQASTQVHMKGSEGTYLTGKQILLLADRELLLKSVNGSVRLWGRGGVRLDVSRRGGLPYVRERAGDASSSTEYRLCACVHLPAPDQTAPRVGRLFRIRAETGRDAKSVTCRDAALHGAQNPCV